jgi:hypothetical protein
MLILLDSLVEHPNYVKVTTVLENSVMERQPVLILLPGVSVFLLRRPLDSHVEARNPAKPTSVMEAPMSRIYLPAERTWLDVYVFLVRIPQDFLRARISF